MMPSRHVAASAATSAAFFAATRSWPGTIACFFSGILIDLDHVLDYCLIKKQMCWSYRKLKEFCLNPDGKIYLFLHSYELIAVLWGLVSWVHADLFWVGFLFGMSVHLIIDQFANTIYPDYALSYFFFYRMKLGFPKIIFFEQSFFHK